MEYNSYNALFDYLNEEDMILKRQIVKIPLSVFHDFLLEILNIIQASMTIKNNDIFRQYILRFPIAHFVLFESDCVIKLKWGALTDIKSCLLVALMLEHAFTFIIERPQVIDMNEDVVICSSPNIRKATTNVPHPLEDSNEKECNELHFGSSFSVWEFVDIEIGKLDDEITYEELVVNNCCWFFS